MKYLAIIVTTCMLHVHLSCSAQETKDITIGKIESIHSHILNEDRTLWVHVPDNDTDGQFEAPSYPVIYLLDGAAHFHSVVGMMRQLSRNSANAICPKMMVVAIPNTNRTRDLTPSKATTGPAWLDTSMMNQSGGGENFLTFLESELIPYIDSLYPTDPYRMLIGHSFGGLTVMNALVQRPHVFNSYVAIDPSMWWDEMKLLRQIEHITFDQNYENKSLFIGIANTMSSEMDTLSVQNDTTEATDHIRAILKLNSVLKSDQNKYLSHGAKYYPNENHGSVPFITEYDALHHIFDFYKLAITLPDRLNPEIDILSKVEHHYKKLSQVFGKEVLPEERFINRLGHQFLGAKQYDRAEKFFLLNIKNHPQNHNHYESLGDLYLKLDKKELAIKNYTKAVELDNNSAAAKKLRNLRE